MAKKKELKLVKEKPKPELIPMTESMKALLLEQEARYKIELDMLSRYQSKEQRRTLEQFEKELKLKGEFDVDLNIFHFVRRTKK